MDGVIIYETWNRVDVMIIGTCWSQ